MPPRDISPEIIGYIAGLIDGEGCIWLDFKGRFQLNVSQSENNKGEQLCKWIKRTLRRGKCYPTKKNWRGRKWIQWSWQANRVRDVKFVLETCLPLLRVKRNAALRAIKGVEEFLNAGRK